MALKEWMTGHLEWFSTDPQAEFNIDRLENALLHTSYLALRQALSDHLERASKKTRIANLAGARREAAIFALNFRKTGCKTVGFRVKVGHEEHESPWKNTSQTEFAVLEKSLRNDQPGGERPR
ncbi:MAG: hypothetical protein F9K25_14945 [Candidatus Contendobacter sp.]|nr:MAG: hypothetical protein F9K25_14945 [Candidatus Contendobacter sp.]MDS4027297.1 hypothetical protein [Candidatus Contendobacter sp.]